MLRRFLYLSRTRFYREIDRIAFNKEFNLMEAITVYGAPRSGTTWLLDLLNVIPEYLVLFEPFFTELFPILKKHDIGPRPYRNPSEEDPELVQLLIDIFTGKIQSKDPNIPMRFYDIFKRLRASKLLIKFTRANRLLPWIQNNFEFNNNFLLIRHPGAIISSQIQSGLTGYGRGIFPTSKDLKKELKSINLFPEQLIKKVDRITKREEALAAAYALDYTIPIQLANEKITTIYYEKLLLDSEREITQIFKILDSQQHIDMAMNRLDIPSHTTVNTEKSYLNETRKQLSKWKNRLSREETENIKKVLNWFNVDFNSSSYSILDNEFSY